MASARFRGLAACVLACWPLAARASPFTSAEPLPVAIEFVACTGMPTKTIERVLAAELRAVVNDDAHATATDTTRVRVSCTAAGLVEIAVADPVTGKRLERPVDLSLVEIEARPRLLALSIAELIGASWIELSATRRAEVRLPTRTASPGAREAALAVTGREMAPGGFDPALEIDAQATARTFERGSLATYGGGVTATRVQRPWFVVYGDALLETGSSLASLGTVGAVLASVSLQALLRLRLGRASIDSGVGGRFAIARFAGTPNSGSVAAEAGTLTATWGGPMLATRVRVRVWKRLTLAVAAEGGWVTREIVAIVDQRPFVAIEGAWLSAGLGVGFWW